MAAFVAWRSGSGVRDLTVGAVATNDGAVRFYERRGLVRSIVIFRRRREEV